MEKFFVHFEPKNGEDLAVIQEVKAINIEQAKKTAEMYLAMVHDTYSAATLYSEWKSGWRQCMEKIFFDPNK